jgi:hypothetical protein
MDGHRLDGLTERHGKLSDWSDEIAADCPRKRAKNLNDQCGARCPNLPKSDVSSKHYFLCVRFGVGSNKSSSE